MNAFEKYAAKKKLSALMKNAQSSMTEEQFESFKKHLARQTAQRQARASGRHLVKGKKGERGWEDYGKKMSYPLTTSQPSAGKALVSGKPSGADLSKLQKR